MRVNDFLITIISYLRRQEKRKLIKLSRIFKRKNGIEIGGPSPLFSLKGAFPIYLFASAIDGVNYSDDTIWEGKLEEGPHYKWYTKKGYQFISEGTDLSYIADNTYDFVLSCHNLEHIANPLNAIKEWSRVLKPNGFLILVLPDKDLTFDRKRPFTTMQHLIGDLKRNIGEDDITHFEEIIEHLDLKIGQMREEVIQTIKKNYEFRCVHHHVFSFELIKEMLEWASYEVLLQEKQSPMHLFTMAKKK